MAIYLPITPLTEDSTEKLTLRREGVTLPFIPGNHFTGFLHQPALL